MVSATASGTWRNSRAISAGGFRCRSACASSLRPAVSIVHMLADAGQHVLQRAALGRVVEHVVGGEQGRAGAAGDLGQPRSRRRSAPPWGMVAASQTAPGAHAPGAPGRRRACRIQPA